jgi:hypothetical protein
MKKGFCNFCEKESIFIYNNILDKHVCYVCCETFIDEVKND